LAKTLTGMKERIESKIAQLDRRIEAAWVELKYTVDGGNLALARQKVELIEKLEAQRLILEVIIGH
jgi:hypothetical protein